VFGRVVEGIELVKQIENLDMEGSTPNDPVVIADCGELKVEAVEVEAKE